MRVIPVVADGGVDVERNRELCDAFQLGLYQVGDLVDLGLRHLEQQLVVDL